MTVLITRPNHDDTTAYLYEWSKDIIEVCEKYGIKILNIEGKNVKREKVENFIKSHQPLLLAFNGHGDPESIYGHQNEPILELKSFDENIVKGRVIHAISCNSASLLGYECVNKGAISFIGYKNEFVFFVDSSKSTQPRQDTIVQSFLEPANKVVISIIKGNTVGKSYQISQASYDHWIEYYFAHYPIEAPHILPWLIWDKMQQVVIGREDFKVF